jgi:hypothetical protein
MKSPAMVYLEGMRAIVDSVPTVHPASDEYQPLLQRKAVSGEVALRDANGIPFIRCGDGQQYRIRRRRPAGVRIGVRSCCGDVVGIRIGSSAYSEGVDTDSQCDAKRVSQTPGNATAAAMHSRLPWLGPGRGDRRL